MTIKNKTYLFHPFEIAFCGYSDSGKTTLITQLIEKMTPQYQIGYLKHDAHRFQMDKEGKDTFKAWGKGASQIFIFDPKHTASIHKGVPTFFDKKSLLLDCDFVFMEGYKNSEIEKIVFIDEERKILTSIKNGEINRIMAYVGQNEKKLNDLPTVAPYFNRNNIDGITDFIKTKLQEKVTPINGLVLTGGRSTRMKSDKALLKYNDQSQAEVAFSLLKPFCNQVFISSRKNQWDKEEFENRPQIHDQFLEIGPMGGILSAMKQNRKASWIVVACDLPYLDSSTLQHLIQSRNPFKYSTCYKSIHNSLPEPLCTIYEPKIFSKLLEFIGYGYECPRKALLNLPIELIQPLKKQALENVNTFEEFKQAQAGFQQGAQW